MNDPQEFKEQPEPTPLFMEEPVALQVPAENAEGAEGGEGGDEQ